MSKKKINIAVVGLQFGGHFAPIYSLHPDVDNVGICDTDERLLNQMEREAPVLFKMGELLDGRGREVSHEHITPKPRPDLLPAELARYMEHQDHLDADNPHLSVLQGGAHHGSHPHLVHEFVRSIMEERTPGIDAITAANWTAAGICAHESAMRGGAEVLIPEFD
jgi:hypothetical protein